VYVKLLGRGHQGRLEVKDTLRMISHDVNISIAGGGADVLDEVVLEIECALILIFII